jgi:Fe-Mn family superoxide dismutase
MALLPFQPAKLKGLSEKLLRSHHENNYGGAVKNLNKVEEELARVTKDTSAFVVGGLKERELTFTNSMILHEAYFGNLGGDGKAGGPIQKLLASTHGDFGR